MTSAWPEVAEAVLREAVARVMSAQPVPGGVLVICDRSGGRLEIPFGLANLERGTPVSGRHLFEIGSVSKCLVSILVNRLVDRGVLRLDDYLTELLPWVDVGRYTERITVAHLLTHTAGLVSGVDALTDDLAQVWALRELWAAEPGRHFHYSNAGYLILGLLLARVTGRPHRQLLREEVFDRLGVEGALSGVRNEDRSRLATGYAPACDDRPWLPGDALAPAPWLEAFGADGHVALDAASLVAVLRLLLGADGAEVANPVLSAVALRRMTTVVAPGGEDVMAVRGGLPVASSRYGLGVNVEDIDGEACLTHGGGMVGYASFVLADPARDVAVGTLTNANGDCLAAQLLTRLAHQVVLAVRHGSRPPVQPVVDMAERAGAVPARHLAGLRGTDHGGEVEVTIGSVADAGERRVYTTHGSGRLFRDLYGRWCTDHPALRDSHLHFPAQSLSPASEYPVNGHALVGHYRAHNPWFTNFRIVLRGRSLFLSAPGGVEAPIQDEPLTPMGACTCRVGDDSWLPERLSELAAVDEKAILVDLNGGRYSRTETP